MPGQASPLGALNWALFLGSLVFVQVYRYRRLSSAVERQQTKWVVYGASVAATGFLALIIVLALFGKSLTGL